MLPVTPGPTGAPDGTRTRYDRRDKPAPRRLWLRRRGRLGRNCTRDSGLGNRRDAAFTTSLGRGDRNRTGVAGLEDRSSPVELHPEMCTAARTPGAPSHGAPGGRNFKTLARLSENVSTRPRVFLLNPSTRVAPRPSLRVKTKNPAAFRARGLREFRSSIYVTSSRTLPMPTLKSSEARTSGPSWHGSPDFGPGFANTKAIAAHWRIRSLSVRKPPIRLVFLGRGLS